MPRVTQFDKKTRRVSVSIKALERAEEQEAIAQFGSTDSGASLGDILGAALQAQDGDVDEAPAKPAAKTAAKKDDAGEEE